MAQFRYTGFIQWGTLVGTQAQWFWKINILDLRDPAHWHTEDLEDIIDSSIEQFQRNLYLKTSPRVLEIPYES